MFAYLHNVRDLGWGSIACIKNQSGQMFEGFQKVGKYKGINGSEVPFQCLG